MQWKKKIGMSYGDITPLKDRKDIIRYINFKLIAMGQNAFMPKNDDDSCKTINKDDDLANDEYFIELFEDLIVDYREKSRLLSDKLCPADERLQAFIDKYFEDTKLDIKPQLPNQSFVLDQHGLARELSLPADGHEFKNDYIQSFRIKQGILNNPKSDRRTTKGSFHIVEGPLPVPFDKKEVPKEAFARLFHIACNPPKDLLELPFTSFQEEKSHCFVSAFFRPMVSPRVEGVTEEKSMEVRAFVPGSLVSSLDFIESIFGNAGDPNLYSNDSALDVDHWTGTTGCLLLAPHLLNVKKKDLGLPHWDDATERQRREGMCYQSDEEFYNDGGAFKLTLRDDSGVVITIIADNYFGYFKKEIKTQISYSANLIGLCEEEHAGGTIAFPRTNLGEYFFAKKRINHIDYTFDEMKKKYGDMMHLQEKNYGIDRVHPNIIYLPEEFKVDLHQTKITWKYNNEDVEIKLQPGKVYIHPSGYKVHMEKHPSAPAWKLIGTHAEGTFCHKPCTVSGGGKSEISKSIQNSIIYATHYIGNLEKDLDSVEEIIKHDYRNRWRDEPSRTRPSRTVLSPERSLGSVIKLLSPSSDYTEEYNQWLNEIPNHIKALVFLVKRFYEEEWGDNWRKYFSVDVINGKPGHELNFKSRKIRPSYLRIGFDPDGSWRIYKLRIDFLGAAKIQTEDDISASIVVPAHRLENLDAQYKNKSFKFAENVEYRLFQRPDEAIHRGYDREAEADLSGDNTFITNYEPLTKDQVKEVIEDAMGFEMYTAPVKKMIMDFYNDDTLKYCIIPSHPRMVNGLPTKNPRYQQNRPDFVNPIENYIADIGTRLKRKIPVGKPVYSPVNSVLPGRRNNPPQTVEVDGKVIHVRPLCVYNPIHYQELPELFMDFICSLTGKSPSTTGAGTEGALTKGPFNMLTPTSDLNNALLSYILTGYAGYSSAAGFIGPDNRVDHDISMLVPEIWCRLTEEERDPDLLIKQGALEKIEDFDHNGQKILASRLGYRISSKFLYRYMGRIFDEPQAIFPETMLKPELQDIDAFADGVNNIVEAQQKVAKAYIEDGSVNDAIPPLQVLIYIMAEGNYKGKGIEDKGLRDMFTYDYVVNSSWYNERLKLQQKKDIALWQRHVKYLEDFISRSVNAGIVEKEGYDAKLMDAKKKLKDIQSKEYLESLKGTIGADPLAYKK